MGGLSGVWNKKTPKSWKKQVWKNRFWKKTVLEQPILEKKTVLEKTVFGKNRSTEPWHGGLLPPTPPQLFFKSVFFASMAPWGGGLLPPPPPAIIIILFLRNGFKIIIIMNFKRLPDTLPRSGSDVVLQVFVGGCRPAHPPW